MKISKEYSDRYRVELQKYWNDSNQPISEGQGEGQGQGQEEGQGHLHVHELTPNNLMIKHLHAKLESVVSKMTCPEEEICMVSKDVVILDYLITSHQLLEMIKNNPNGHERFARKSRIE